MLQKEQIEKQGENLAAKNDELMAVNKEKNLMMSMVAHDLKKPINDLTSLALILNDYKACLDNIEELMGASVEQRRISKLENNKLRHEALQVLHHIQINYLSTWRALGEEDKELRDEYLLQLLLLVNVLSGGLKSTG